jgi:hypothetical protein
MPSVTPNEFASVVATAPVLADVVRGTLFGGLPYVFANSPGDWSRLRGSLSARLGCPEEQIVVVGSAKMGFSLAPRKYGRAFRADSDIDVIVIHESLYDQVWLSVLTWHYRRRYRLPPTERRWDQARRDELYWGYLNPTGFRYHGLQRQRDLRDARRVSTLWFNAFQELGRVPAFAGRKVSGRLYRTWDHAVGYHDHGLRELRRALRETS